MSYILDKSREPNLNLKCSAWVFTLEATDVPNRL